MLRYFRRLIFSYVLCLVVPEWGRTLHSCGVLFITPTPKFFRHSLPLRSKCTWSRKVSQSHGLSPRSFSRVLSKTSNFGRDFPLSPIVSIGSGRKSVIGLLWDLHTYTWFLTLFPIMWQLNPLVMRNGIRCCCLCFEGWIQSLCTRMIRVRKVMERIETSL